MMAGHSSVKILSGFAWTMLCMNDLLYFIGDLGPLFIVLALTGLELGVAILQAHVFTILICIYLNDATNLHQNGSSISIYMVLFFVMLYIWFYSLLFSSQELYQGPSLFFL